MICPVCFGRKYDFKKDGNSGYFVECKKCHGTGIVESQTNEEWFCQLSTDEKAYFLSVEAVRAISEYENNGTERTCSSFWECWLKAVHKE